MKRLEKRARHRAGHRQRRSHGMWLAVGLGLFIAADLLLIALAMGWGRDDSDSAGPDVQGSVEAPEQTEEEGSEEPPTGSASPPSEPSSPSASAPSQNVGRTLSVVSENVAWRAEGGACDERGSIELTLDGGETWGSTYPSDEGLGRPLWISGADYTALQVAVATREECAPEGFTTSDSGASWATEEQVMETAAFVDPNDRSRLVWADEGVAGPCEEIVDVALTDGGATVACSDGSLWSVEDQSDEWMKHAVEGAAAVGGSQDVWVAAVESAQCDDLTLVELNQEFFQMINCVTAAPDEEMAVDLAGSTLWLWTGDEVRISADGGRSLN